MLLFALFALSALLPRGLALTVPGSANVLRPVLRTGLPLYFAAPGTITANPLHGGVQPVAILGVGGIRWVGCSAQRNKGGGGRSPPEDIRGAEYPARLIQKKRRYGGRAGELPRQTGQRLRVPHYQSPRADADGFLAFHYLQLLIDALA